MRLRHLGFLALAGLLLAPRPGFAINQGANQPMDGLWRVTSCGALSPYGAIGATPTVGLGATLTVDQLGQLCINTSGATPGTGTIGSAVPSTGTYVAYNLGGTLTGETGNSFGAYIDAASGSNLLVALQAGTGSTGAAVPSAAVYVAGVNGGNLTGIAVDASGRVITSPNGATNSKAQSGSLGATLVAKNSAGTLFGFYCTAITGGTTGFCEAFNATSAPTSGAQTPIDVCYFNSTAGCSLNRIPIGVAYGTGISLTISSNASPFTVTTGTLTGFISADYQ